MKWQSYFNKISHLLFFSPLYLDAVRFSLHVNTFFRDCKQNPYIHSFTHGKIPTRIRGSPDDGIIKKKKCSTRKKLIQNEKETKKWRRKKYTTTCRRKEESLLGTRASVIQVKILFTDDNAAMVVEVSASFEVEFSNICVQI